MNWLHIRLVAALALALGLGSGGALSAAAEPPTPAPQIFPQELSEAYDESYGFPAGEIAWVDVAPDGAVRALARGGWYELAREGGWQFLVDWSAKGPNELVVDNGSGRPVRVALPWGELRQICRLGERTWIVTGTGIYELAADGLRSLNWPNGNEVRQIAVATDGTVWVASAGGLFRRAESIWEPVRILDEGGRAWAVQDVLGVALCEDRNLWVATKAGVIRSEGGGWRFFEGKDGLPWNEFTGVACDGQGRVWFGTSRGVVRWDQAGWHYRQGRRWLPHDAVRGLTVDPRGGVWLATGGGVGRITFQAMTLAQKAEHYEAEIERYVKRTPYGYVAEAWLRRAGDRESADPQDSDNDGLWTAMYGAGQCFAYGATGDELALARARQAFEALRFLQKVTQGGDPAPPKGYVARTIRPVDWPDPNEGRLAGDRAAQSRDRLWKVYEPRWPRSADGQWYWKSDTSSDELDGHFFFYPLYYDLCAKTEDEKERVREVVRDLADHFLTHGYVLIDHDGRPTRWAVFAPGDLNRNPDWWPERGLNSLSMLSYLAAAAHVTGEARFEAALQELVEVHGYAHNAMFPKVQQGPGSGNQSDDEMAFMCYYTLLRCAPDEALKAQIRWSFFRYWANEAAEMNPFFHFAYAAHNLGATGTNPWGRFPLDPWGDWFEDAINTLRGFPLDRLNWAHQNSHRLDLVRLRPPAMVDLYEPDRGRRGYRVNGKVLPVENRHFNHWNTDPWELDYGGSGNELAAGTVYLLPYYLGLYHGFIAKPAPTR